MKITYVDVGDFKYVSKYADPDREYFGSAACRFIALDVIHQILHNRNIIPGCEPRYFSHVVSISTEYLYWDMSIDFDLLDLDNFEIIAVCNINNTRIHVKNDKWFDNVDELRGTKTFIEAAAIYKSIECIIKEIKYIYSNRSKKYCKVFAQKYRSDFEEE